MKKQLQKKITAFIVTAMMFCASANAQIVYTAAFQMLCVAATIPVLAEPIF